MGRRYLSPTWPPTSYTGGITLSKSDDSRGLPKSIRHKRILDEAAEHPDASLAELAAEIPSATPDLVEHVLEEYGDPADAGPTESPEAADGPETTGGIRDQSAGAAVVDDEDGGDGDDTIDDEDALESEDGIHDEDEDDVVATGEEDADPDEEDPESEDGSPADRAGKPSYPDADSLTEKQRRTLEAIRESPEATQGELAADLDVTAPTISNRVNSLPGFEWSQRESFVDEVLPRSTQPSPMDTATTAPEDDTEPTDDLEALAERLDALESRVDESEEPDGNRAAAVFADPELLHKVVHACMASEAITEDEELRILEALLPTPAAEA